jgi:hypothetical protein
MIRKLTGIGISRMRPFVFTRICSIARTKINGELTQQQGSTTLNAVNQGADISPENKDKVLADSSSFGSSASTFFLESKGLDMAIPASTLPAPTK